MLGIVHVNGQPDRCMYIRHEDEHGSSGVWVDYNGFRYL